jgi:hypothetical protein
MNSCTKSEAKAYSDKLDKAMMANFEVGGIVNNHDFITDAEASVSG